MTRVLAILILPALLPYSIVMACPTALNHPLRDLQGNPANLCQYQGKVILAVNTASFCGNTPQYKGLQALYTKYRERGLVVIGFPANDFGAQEPGTATEIKDFCETRYSVSFPLMEKTSVVAGKANPVFAALTKLSGAAPEWNFHKYLLSRDGLKAISFAARTAPESAEIVTAIERLLEQH